MHVEHAISRAKKKKKNQSAKSTDSYKVQSGLVQIQFNLITLPNALSCLLFKTRNVMKPPFSDDTASNGKKKKKKTRLLL